MAWVPAIEELRGTEASHQSEKALHFSLNLDIRLGAHHGADYTASLTPLTEAHLGCHPADRIVPFANSGQPNLSHKVICWPRSVVRRAVL